MTKIPYLDLKLQYQTIRGEVLAALEAVCESTAFAQGPPTKVFERDFASYCEVNHCFSLNSGTSALHLALRCLDVGAGDEVITIPFTFVATTWAISYVGARPVFVDIDPKRRTMDPGQLEAAITARTKAIIPVSLFGQMPDYDRLKVVAARHGLAVIEDGAQSFGATQRGRRSCGVTLIGSTSFYPAKPLGCYGDGGALFTSDDELAGRMRAIRTHGGLRRHEHSLLGLNGRFDTLQAAVLLAKWPHFEAEVKARERLGAWYTGCLRGVCAVPEVVPGNTHVYAQYTVRVPQRDLVAERLKAMGVPTAVYYPRCVHEQPPFRGCRGQAGGGGFPEAERAAREVLSLPLHPFLSEADQNRVIAAVETVVRAVRGG